MKKALVLMLFTLLACACGASQCTPDPVSPTPAAGGAPSGGSTSTGGTTAATTTAGIRWLECRPVSKAPAAERSYRHLLSGWKPTPARQKAMRARALAAYSVVAPSAFWDPNFKTPLEQWIGSCTGHSAAQHLSTAPFDGRLTDNDAMRIYALATTLDPYEGTYPPTDTGSNTASAARAAKALGFTAREYYAVDTLEELQRALQRSSCLIGTPWYKGFSHPAPCGEMVASGVVEGGHAEAVVAWDAELKRIVTRNSWGPGYGNCRKGDPDECGYAYWSAGTLQRLIGEGAEIDCPRME
jgi:hypothetical protein